jgi:hypothetical protein
VSRDGTTDNFDGKKLGPDDKVYCSAVGLTVDTLDGSAAG